MNTNAMKKTRPCYKQRRVSYLRVPSKDLIL